MRPSGLLLFAAFGIFKSSSVMKRPPSRSGPMRLIACSCGAGADLPPALANRQRGTRTRKNVVVGKSRIGPAPAGWFGEIGPGRAVTLRQGHAFREEGEFNYGSNQVEIATRFVAGTTGLSRGTFGAHGQGRR